MAITTSHEQENKKKNLLTKIPITRTKRPINSITAAVKSTVCKICSKKFEFPSELSKHLLYHDSK